MTLRREVHELYEQYAEAARSLNLTKIKPATAKIETAQERLAV